MMLLKFSSWMIKRRAYRRRLVRFASFWPPYLRISAQRPGYQSLVRKIRLLEMFACDCSTVSTSYCPPWSTILSSRHVFETVSLPRSSCNLPVHFPLISPASWCRRSRNHPAAVALCPWKQKWGRAWSCKYLPITWSCRMVDRTTAERRNSVHRNTRSSLQIQQCLHKSSRSLYVAYFATIVVIIASTYLSLF